MKKRICIMLLGLLAFSLIITPVSVSAEGARTVSDDTVMTINTTEYTDFEEGWNKAIELTQDGEEGIYVKLHADWTADSDGSFGEGVGFRRGAIYIPEDTIDLDLDLNGHTIDRGLFKWSDFSEKYTVSNQRKSGEVINIEEGVQHISIMNGTIKGAGNSNNGGIYIDDCYDIFFFNVTFTENRAQRGGAMYIKDSWVTVKGCKFIRNYATSTGGAIAMENSRLKTDANEDVNTVFEYNKANSGGALYCFKNSDLDINYTEFKHNDTAIFDNNENEKNGGAIASFDTNITLKKSLFESNTAGKNGGAINQSGGGYTIRFTDFKNNEAGDRGGVFNNVSGSMSITDAKITGNHAGKSAGVGYVVGSIYISGCEIKNNTISSSDGPSVFFLHGECYADVGYSSIMENKGGKAAILLSVNNIFYQADFKLFGKVHIIDNLNSDGKQANVANEEYGALSTSVFLDENFSTDSRIGLMMGDSTLAGDDAVEYIPDGWTNSELAAVFSLDPVLYDGGSAEEFYLARSGDGLLFKKGDPKLDESSLLEGDDPNIEVFAVLSDGSVEKLHSTRYRLEGWSKAMKYAGDTKKMASLGYESIKIDILDNWIPKDGEFDADFFNHDGFDYDTLYVPENANVTINLHGYTIDRGLTEWEYHGYVLKIGNNAVVTLNGGANADDSTIGTIRGGYDFNAGGGIVVMEDAMLTLNNVAVNHNYTRDKSGAGISLFGGATLNMNGGSISYNTVESNDKNYGGSAISVYDAMVSLNNVEIAFNETKDNYSSVAGSLFFIVGSTTLTLDGCNIHDNVKDNVSSSIIYLKSEDGRDTTFVCKNTKFANNGKANPDSDFYTIFISTNEYQHTNITIADSEFTGNDTEGYFFKLYETDIEVTNTKFTNNKSAILIVPYSYSNDKDKYISAGSFTDCDFIGNTREGAFNVNWPTKINFIDCDFGDSEFKYGKYGNLYFGDKHLASIFGEGSVDVVILTTVAMVAVGVAIYFYVRLKKVSSASKNVSKKDEEE